jgi:hypothetical protein
MARHWRKPYRSTAQLNSLAGWLVGATMMLGALVFIARHLYI